MPKKAISSGGVHKIPPDFRKALASDKAALAAWEDIRVRLASGLIVSQ